MENSSQSLIYQAVYLTAHELFRGRSGRKAIVLLTDGQDSGLGLTWDPASMQARPGAASPLAFDDVARELASQGIALYAISTEGRPKAMTDAWLADHQREPVITPEARRLGAPLDSLYLAEMVRQAGGEIYFLREMGGLAGVYQRIALALGAEYTLGYYPASGTARPGWRELDVELRPGASAVPAGARVTHRAAYYVSAASLVATSAACSDRMERISMFTRKRYRVRLPSRTLVLGRAHPDDGRAQRHARQLFRWRHIS